MEYTTYVIKDPRDNSPIFIGQTSDFDKRKRQYIKKACSNNPPNIKTMNINIYLIRLKNLGFEPVIEPIENYTTEDESLLSKTGWITKYVEQGFPLLNRTKEHRAIVMKKFNSTFLKKYFEEKII